MLRAGRTGSMANYFFPPLQVRFLSFSHVHDESCVRGKSTLLLLKALKKTLKGVWKLWVDSLLCLLISFIYFDKFPGHSVKCFGIGGGNQPVLAPVRKCENQWCLDKLAINPDICSASSSSLSSTEQNNKKNKPPKRALCACIQCWIGACRDERCSSSMEGS